MSNSEDWFLIIMFVASMPHLFAEMCRSKCGVPSAWIAVERNICYGTSGDKYANIRIKDECNLFAIRLSHVSGFQNTNKHDSNARSRWGVNANHPTYFGTVLVRNDQLWIPKSRVYELYGFGINDDVIFFKHNETLSAGTEIQVWFVADYESNNEDKNEGTHCIDVDISCLV